MRTFPHHARGFSLVEILVAMVIALLGTIIIFQVFSVSEGIKRTSTSGGDAQQFGALSLFTIERDLRMAGYGFNNSRLLGCTVNAYDELAVPPDLPAFKLAPVVITVGANDSIADEITLMYSTSDLIANPAKITQNMPNPASVYKVNNRFGFTEGDLIIAAEAGKACSLGQVTGVPGGGQSDNVVHNPGNYTNANGVSVPARYNKPAGLGVDYTTEGVIFNLGAGPVINTYRVDANQLVLDSGLAVSTLALADNIVLLKAQYGKDTTADGSVDVYENTMPLLPTAADWAAILTVRLAIVARSAQPEKANVQGGACDATTATPDWSGGTLDLSADPNWQCYRYRVFETTVPLRNLLWQQSS